MSIDRLYDRSWIDKYRAAGGVYLDMTLWDHANLNSLKWPNHEAIIDSFSSSLRRLTWQQVIEKVNLIIFHLLELGVKKEDVVIVHLPLIIENYLMRVALTKIGALALPYSDALRETEIENMTKFSDAKTAVIASPIREMNTAEVYLNIWPQCPKLEYIFVVGNLLREGMKSFSDLLDPEIQRKYSYKDLDNLQRNPEDLYVMNTTSGTTGTPKIILHTLDAFAGSALRMVQACNITPKDVLLGLTPLSGGTGSLYCLEVPIIGGAKLIYLSHFDEEEALKIIEQERVTGLMGVPTLMIRILNNKNFTKYDTSSLRLFGNAGAPLPSEIGEKLYELGIIPQSSSGTSESTHGTLTGGVYGSRYENIYTVGKCPVGIGQRIIDPEGNDVPRGEPGEILIWNVCGGYYKNPDATKEMWDENGWLHTGDVGILDEEGNLKIIGRIKDMILRGGQNIFPKEIEELLFEHPKVKEVAIVGMPDEIFGEKACAFIVPKNEDDPITFEQMINFLEDKKIAKYKYPERLEIINELPQSSGGKILKEKLKGMIKEKIYNNKQWGID